MSSSKCLFCFTTSVGPFTSRKSPHKSQWDSEEQRSPEKLESQAIEDTLSFLCKSLQLENLDLKEAQFCESCHQILVQLQSIQIELRRILGIIEDKIQSSATELEDQQQSNSSCPSHPHPTTIDDKAGNKTTAEFLNIATNFRRIVCENVRKRRASCNPTSTESSTTSSLALTLPVHVDMSLCVLEKEAVLWEQEEPFTMKTGMTSDESCTSFGEDRMDTEMENTSTTTTFRPIYPDDLDSCTSTAQAPVIISTVSVSKKRKRPPKGQRSVPSYCRVCPYKCTEAKAKSDPLLMRRHELTYHYHSEELLHVCEICKIKFSIPELLSAHMKTHAKDQETFHCEMCPLELKKESPIFDSGNGLQLHIFTTHIAKPPPFEIPVIVKKSRTSPEGYSCHLCPMHYSQKSKLKTHMKFHELKSLPANLYCEFCSYVGKTLDQLEKHLLWNHENKILEEEKHTECSYCPRKFASTIIKTRHELIRHPHLNEIEVAVPTDSKPAKVSKDKTNRFKSKFFCDFCDQSFIDDGKLLIHCTLHCAKNGHTTKVKASAACFQPICQGSKFGSKRELFHHQRLIHPELLIYVCSTCGKKYSHEDMLNTHLKTHEENEGAKYQCNVCKSVIQTRDALIEHLAYHNGEDLDTGFKCHICGKLFMREWNLNSHLETVHVNLEDMLQCDECHRNFPTQKRLKAHKLRAHPKENAMIFPCGECDKIFYSNSALNSHFKCVHQMTEMTICSICGKLVKNMGVHMRRGHERKMRYQCYFCQKLFFCGFELSCHLRIHTGEHPFKCDFCNKDFTQKHCLISHQNKYHQQINQ